LEERSLLSTGAGAEAPLHGVLPLAGPWSGRAYTPAQVRHAYGFDKVASTGAGQTVAVIDAYDDPNIAGDLAAFDRQFGLPGRSVGQVQGFLTKVNQSGGRTPLPPGDAGWAGEISLDVEWAHAIAPLAKILLVEASSSSSDDLLTAIDYARRQPGVSVVSMSFGGGEFYGENDYDSYFTTPPGHGGVTFVASAGDGSAYAGAEWPSVSPGVIAVGGTSLYLGPSGLRQGETAWSDGGGGYSWYESEPAFQRGVQNSGARTVPDVAYDADPSTGFYVRDTYGLSWGQSGWFAFGGTSAGAPQWAALVALANQARAAAGRPALDNALPALYGAPSSAFFDVTSGSNGYAAHSGYDLATGRGSPLADRVLASLLNATSGNAAQGVGHPSGLPQVRSGGPHAAAIALHVEETLTGSLAPAPVRQTADAVWTRPTEAPRSESQAVNLDALVLECLGHAIQTDARGQLGGGGATTTTDVGDDVWPAETASPEAPGWGWEEGFPPPEAF
jgi:subtilase family serine protease